MKIHVYVTDDPDVPANARAMARIRCMMIGKGGKLSLQWSPIYAMAADADAARAKAQAWWDGEREKYAKLSDKGKRRAWAEASMSERDLPAFEDAPPAAAPGKAEAWEEEAV